MMAAILFVAGMARATAAPGVYLAPGSAGSPHFGVDARWPHELPNNWIIGQVGGLSVDKANNIWVYQRPESDTADELDAAQSPQVAGCCLPAPPVLEFNAQGDLVNAWGPIQNITCCAPGTTVPGTNPNGPAPTTYDWIKVEHGIYADDKGFVWLTGNGTGDRQILKFTRDGTFVMQIGTPGTTCSNLDTMNICKGAQFYVDTPANEVYVADGYGNHRGAVFNANNGKFNRAWGAFGATATTGATTTGYGVIPPLAATYPAYTYTPGHPSSYFNNPFSPHHQRPGHGLHLGVRSDQRPAASLHAGRHVRRAVLFRASDARPGLRVGSEVLAERHRQGRADDRRHEPSRARVPPETVCDDGAHDAVERVSARRPVRTLRPERGLLPLGARRRRRLQRQLLRRRSRHR